MPLTDGNSGEYHFGCKGLRLSDEATPTRRSHREHVFRPIKDPSWEKGIAGEQRPGGTFMPYLDDERAPIGVKEAGERRHELGAQVHRLKNDPNVFRAEREAAVHTT